MEPIDPLNFVTDLTELNPLSENAIVEVLNARFVQRNIYTYCSNILISVNPYEMLEDLYTASIAEEYKQQVLGSLPPHIFALADNSYRNMLTTRRNQSFVISGESGAGKSEAAKLVLNHLASLSESHDGIEHMIVETSPILEAFGNAVTVQNDNSSRFGKFMKLSFNEEGTMSGAQIVVYLLEKVRVVEQNEKEKNYHIFYYLVNGTSDEFKKEYHIRPANEYEFLKYTDTTLSKDDHEMFLSIKMAFKFLKISSAMQSGIWKTLSGILSLGNIAFVPGKGNYAKIHHKEELTIASTLLEISPEELEKGLLFKVSVIKGEKISSPLTVEQAKENRNALCKELYQSLFNWLIGHFNSKLTNTGTFSISVLDIFGFENLKKNSFEQFCINFANEKLHQFFNMHVFHLEQEEYQREGLSWESIAFKDNSSCIQLIEGKMGIFDLLSEQVRFPNSNDTILLDKITSSCSKHPCFFRHKLDHNSFTIKHYAGDVSYFIDRFLNKNRDKLQDNLVSLLSTSENSYISKLVRGDQNTLTLAEQFKKDLNGLMKELESTNPWYIRCIKPNHNKQMREFNAEYVLYQLSYSGMMETVHIRKLGHPHRISHEEFYKRYRILIHPYELNTTASLIERVELIINTLKLKDAQIGKTKIFLKKIDDIDFKRLQRLDSSAGTIQKTWKMYLAKKKYFQTRQSIIKIQRFGRSIISRNAFLAKKRAAIIFQRTIRKHLQYVKYLKAVEEQKMRALEHKPEENSFIINQPEPAIIPVKDALTPSMPILTDEVVKKTLQSSRSFYRKLSTDEELEKTSERHSSISDRIPTENELVELKSFEIKKIITKVEDANNNRFIDFAKLHFVPQKSGTFTKKQTDISKLSTYSKKMLRNSLLGIPPKLHKTALQTFGDIMSYLKSDKPDFAAAKRILQCGLEEKELRDEIYCQIFKQSRGNPKESERVKCWELLVFCTATFLPPEYLLLVCASEFFLEATNPSNPESATVLLAQTAKHLLEKQKSLSLARTMVPSVEELQDLVKLKPLRFQVQFMDKTFLDLDVDSWTTAEEAVNIIRKHLRSLTPGFSLFRVYKSLELRLFSTELLSEVLAIHEEIQRKAKKINIDFYVLFKCSLFMKPRERWEDPVMNKLLIDQGVVEIEKTILPCSIEVAIKLAAIQLTLKYGFKENIQWNILKNYLPFNFQSITKIQIEVCENMLRHEIQQLIGKSVQDLEDLYLSTLKHLPWYGTTFFPIVRTDNREGKFLAINVDGFQILDENKKVLETHYFTRITTSENTVDSVKICFKNSRTQCIQFQTNQSSEVIALIDEYTHYVRKSCKYALVLDDVPATKGTSYLNLKKGDLITVSKRQPGSWFSGLFKNQEGLFPIESVQLLLYQPKNNQYESPVDQYDKFLDLGSSLLSDFIETNFRQTRNRSSSASLLFSKTKSTGVNTSKRFYYSKEPLTESLTVIENPELSSQAITIFNHILKFMGDKSKKGSETLFSLAQKIIQSALDHPELRDEVFCQIIKQISRNYNIKSEILGWNLLALIFGCFSPSSQLSKAFIQFLQLSSFRTKEIGNLAKYCLSLLQKNSLARKLAPSKFEFDSVQRAIGTGELKSILFRVYLPNGAYKGINGDPRITIQELFKEILSRLNITERDGLTLCEEIGNSLHPLENSATNAMAACDLISTWELDDPNLEISRFSLRKTFFSNSEVTILDPIVVDIVYHQAKKEVLEGVLPVSEELAVELAVLNLKDNAKNSNAVLNSNQLDSLLPSKLLPNKEVSEWIALLMEKYDKVSETERTPKQRYLKLLATNCIFFGATRFLVNYHPGRLFLYMSHRGAWVTEVDSFKILQFWNYPDILQYAFIETYFIILAGNLQRPKKFFFSTPEIELVAKVFEQYQAERKNSKYKPRAFSLG